MKSKALIFLLATTLAVLLSGCNAPDSHGNVYRQWSSRMAEMGIFPVYPPRESVTVGDVYALPLHPYDTAAVGYIGGLGNAGIHVEYLGDTNLGWTNLLLKLEQFNQTRPYPADSLDDLSGTNGPMTRISGYGDGTNRTSAFAGGSVARLRQVSFPDFNVSHVDQKSLSAVIPIEGIMSSLNFNRTDILGVHFSIPHAESYGLTTEQLLHELYVKGYFHKTEQGEIYLLGNSKTNIISVAGGQLAYAMFNDILHHVSGNPEYKIPGKIRRHMARSARAMTNQIYLALVSEVYFARSMDITIERKAARGTTLAARPIGTSELKQMKDLGLLAVRSRTNVTSSTNTTVDANGTNVIVGTKAEMIDVTEADTAFDLARKLRELEMPDGVSNTGGSVKVLRASASSIGLRRTFERPICVGVRGVIIKVNVNEPIALSEKGPKEWMKVESFGR
jgi:hypothetical protein